MYKQFWTWFLKHEARFYKVVKAGNQIEAEFFKKLKPQLQAVADDIFYVCGMYDEATAELIFTSDGVVKNMVFIEELVQNAPIIKG
ncbi:MAG TPA: hypothetical protein PKD90_07870 [Phnomibacter sp.]|nr:hypothetical protein [Phnomibacter sp.]